MKNLIKLIIPAIIILLTVGCQDRGKESPFLNDFNKETVKGVYANGQQSFVYNDIDHQMATNSRNNTFRYQTHAQNIYINMLLSKSGPAVGTTLTLTVDSKGIADVPSGDYTVTVTKKHTANGEELSWLWCDDKNIGFIIPDLR